jgi:diacylglycerol kinase (ATP)
MEDHDPQTVRGVLICANPFSGVGPNGRRVEALVGGLSARGLEARIVWDIKERGAALSDPGLARWCRCVVVAGGDGSIGAVANEMDQAGALPAARDNRQAVALATLPMGNENLFAKHYGFTRGTEALAQAIKRGQTRRVDLGRVTHRGQETDAQLFTLMAGIGFDAEVVHRMDRWRTDKPGKLKRVRRISYLPRVASSVWGYGYPQLTIQVGGRELTGTHLFVFNLPEYGGGMGIAPTGCRGDDGLLDWVIFNRPGVLPLLGYAWSVLRQKHLNRRDVQHGRSASLTITTVSDAPAPPVQMDGDPAGVLPVSVSIDDRVGLELLIT